MRYKRGCRKVQVIAYSQGTSQLMITLAQSALAREYISQAILLAPCFLPSPNIVTNYDDFRAARLAFNERGIYSWFGPNWEAQLDKDICPANCATDLFCQAFNPLA